MPHAYDNLVSHINSAINELERLNLGKSLAKGRVGEILLAHKLGHKLHVGDKGADGIDPKTNRRYEYKVSQDNQFNFNFGHARKKGQTASSLAEEHFTGLSGAYCAQMDGTRFVKIVYCPVEKILPYLTSHLENVKGSTFQKNFGSIASFEKMGGENIDFI